MHPARRRSGDHCAGLSLLVEIADDAPLLLADRTRLIEILLNLLSNAIKFTEPAGTVTLAVRRSAGGEAVFEVRDTGVGMTAAEIEIALFSPLVRSMPVSTANATAPVWDYPWCDGSSSSMAVRLGSTAAKGPAPR